MNTQARTCSNSCLRSIEQKRKNTKHLSNWGFSISSCFFIKTQVCTWNLTKHFCFNSHFPLTRTRTPFSFSLPSSMFPCFHVSRFPIAKFLTPVGTQTPRSKQTTQSGTARAHTDKLTDKLTPRQKPLTWTLKVHHRAKPPTLTLIVPKSAFSLKIGGFKVETSFFGPSVASFRPISKSR